MAGIKELERDLNELAFADPLEPALLYHIQASANRTKPSSSYEKICLFVVSAIFGILADRLEKNDDEVTATDTFDSVLNNSRLALGQTRYSDGEIYICALIDTVKKQAQLN